MMAWFSALMSTPRSAVSRSLKRCRVRSFRKFCRPRRPSFGKSQPSVGDFADCA